MVDAWIPRKCEKSAEVTVEFTVGASKMSRKKPQNISIAVAVGVPSLFMCTQLGTPGGFPRQAQ